MKDLVWICKSVQKYKQYMTHQVPVIANSTGSVEKLMLMW
jgi:hypothetical protein